MHGIHTSISTQQITQGHKMTLLCLGCLKAWSSTMNPAMYVAYLLLTFFLGVLLLPFLLPISLIFRIYRHTLMDIIRRKKPEVQFVTGVDSVWLQDSKTNPAIINSVIQMHGKPDIQAFRKRFMNSLVELKDENGNHILFKAKCYANQLLRRYIWEHDSNFSIDKHVYMYKGPAPKTTGDLRRIAGELCSKPFPPKSAMWEFVVVPGPTEKEDCFHCVFRVHHSVADGISLVKLLLTKMVDENSPENNALLKRFATTGKPWQNVGAILAFPGILLEKVFIGADVNSIHGQQLSGDKVVAWSKRLSLDLIKKIKNATQTTVNDILMTCVASAFYEYLKNNSSTMPDEIKAYVPVDIRPPSDELTLDNQFSLLIFALPVKAKNRMERLQKTKRTMGELKKSPEPIVNSLFLRYCMARLPNWLTRWGFDWFSSKCSIVLSNVPGPQKEVSMCGHPINDMVFWPPQRASVGMGISILSYAGHVRAGILADKAITSKPEILMRHFEEEVEQMALDLDLS